MTMKLGMEEYTVGHSRTPNFTMIGQWGGYGNPDNSKFGQICK